MVPQVLEEILRMLCASRLVYFGVESNVFDERHFSVEKKATMRITATRKFRWVTVVVVLVEGEAEEAGAESVDAMEVIEG